MTCFLALKKNVINKGLKDIKDKQKKIENVIRKMNTIKLEKGFNCIKSHCYSSIRLAKYESGMTTIEKIFQLN